MLDLVGNPNCWFSHAQAQLFLAASYCNVKHFITVNGSLFVMAFKIGLSVFASLPILMDVTITLFLF